LIKLFCPTLKAYADYPHTGAEYQAGYDMTIRALDAETPATAFVGNSDDIAFGILAALADRGIRVPEDVSVAGFDNNRISGMPQISLTTVEHSSWQQGQNAVEMIHRKNTSREAGNDNMPIVRMEYEPELIVRGSTGPAKPHT
jgi:DNA-binding LacI/PurR family transcriptional regulator